MTLNGLNFYENVSYNAKIIQAFPPQERISIISFDYFFGVKVEKFLSYELEGFHLFVDDLQSYQPSKNDVQFEHIAEFIKKTNTMAAISWNLLRRGCRSKMEMINTTDQIKRSKLCFQNLFLISGFSEPCLELVSFITVLERNFKAKLNNAYMK